MLLSTVTYAQPQVAIKEMHITIPLSDKLSFRYKKYLLNTYDYLGYEVKFEKILVARAREMVDAGRLDAILIAEKEIEQVYSNIIRVPVILAKGALVLFCAKEVICHQGVLNDDRKLIGVVSGHSISANFMQQKYASTHEVKGLDDLGVMLSRKRLNYALFVYEEQIGTIGLFDEEKFQKTEIYRSEGYHYIHKKHKALLPEITKALKLAIEELGPLVIEN
jgi:hypothetical protein